MFLILKVFIFIYKINDYKKKSNIIISCEKIKIISVRLSTYMFFN